MISVSFNGDLAGRHVGMVNVKAGVDFLQVSKLSGTGM